MRHLASNREGRSSASAIPLLHPPVPAEGEISSGFIAFEDEGVHDGYEDDFGIGDTYEASNLGHNDQDWVLCDKDCGWCGHCGDGLEL